MFNPLDGMMKRGIPIYSSEIEKLLIECGCVIDRITFPKIVAKFPSILQILCLIFWQQVVLPFRAICFRPDVIFDAYNGYSILAANIFPSICVVHDFIPFERKYWFFRPGCLYQRVLHVIAPFCTRLHLFYISQRVADTGRDFIKMDAALLPNIVKPLDSTPGFDFSEGGAADFFACARNVKATIVATISGSGANKDFSGLLDMLSKAGVNIYLIAFGFAEKFEIEYSPTLKAFCPGVSSSSLIAGAIKNSDVFVFHSLSEGFGRPIVEALMVGAKVVCSNVSPALDSISELARANLFVYECKERFSEVFMDALSFENIEVNKNSVLSYGEHDLVESIKRVVFNTL